MKQRIAIGALAITLFAVRGPAQTPTAAEQLEKAIHTQMAAGDVDAAIQMYRDIVNSAPAQKQYAAQAQYRLVMALIQKGDLNAAQREFQNLAFNYSEYKDLIASMSARARGLPQGPSISLGKLTINNPGANQHESYHHNLTGVEFSVPAGLHIDGDSDSSGGGDIVMLSEAGNGKSFAAVWLRPNEQVWGNVEAQLRKALEDKAAGRADLTGWKVRPESVFLRTVGGQQALTAIADFTDGSAKMAEFLTWVFSPKSHVFFFGRTTLEKFPELQAHIEQLMGTARIP